MLISHIKLRSDEDDTGLPSPSYFPFASLKAEALAKDFFPLASPSSIRSTSSPSLSWLWRLLGSDDNMTQIEVPKAPTPNDGGLNLSTALQYGPATGIAPLQRFIKEFTGKVYQPAYSDWKTLVHTGNTDG